MADRSGPVAYGARSAYEELEVESDFGNAKSYEWLRDTAVLCFNPADEDSAEEEIVGRAMVAAAEFIERQPCTCKTSDPENDRTVPYDDGDQCARCAVLGRYFDTPISR